MNMLMNQSYKVLTLSIDIKLDQIDDTHRIYSLTKDGGNKKSRPITVKFVRYANRCNIVSNKNGLKGKNISFAESLTKKRTIRLKEAKNQYGVKLLWSIDRKILFQDDNSPSTNFS